MPETQPPRWRDRRLGDRARAAMQLRHLSPRTQETYLRWMIRFHDFNGRRNPTELGAEQVTSFLSALATRDRVAASTLKAPHVACGPGVGREGRRPKVVLRAGVRHPQVKTRTSSGCRGPAAERRSVGRRGAARMARKSRLIPAYKRGAVPQSWLALPTTGSRFLSELVLTPQVDRIARYLDAWSPLPTSSCSRAPLSVNSHFLS